MADFSKAPNAISGTSSPPLRQLIPFNPDRFDAMMSVLYKKHGNCFTQQDIVKTHVMADVYHVLFHGKPIIGGALERWPGGPVVKTAYNRMVYAGHRWDEDKSQPETFKVAGKRKKAYLFEPTLIVAEDDFSQSEIDAMERAWQCVMSKSYNEREQFFHSEDTFMGKAWTKAGETGNPIAWEDIIDAYSEMNSDYHIGEHIKVLVGF